MKREDKFKFLILLSSEILKICELHRYEPDPSLLEDTARNIASNNKYFTADMVLSAINDYKLIKVEFFTLAGLIHFVNEKVSYIARKQAEDKKKKENEKFLLSLKVELTPEQEEERLRKKEELEKMLNPINEKATKFTGFRKPFKKDEEYEKFKNSLK